MQRLENWSDLPSVHFPLISKTGVIKSQNSFFWLLSALLLLLKLLNILRYIKAFVHIRKQRLVTFVLAVSMLNPVHVYVTVYYAVEIFLCIFPAIYKGN